MGVQGVDTPEEFAAYLRQENERWARVIREDPKNRNLLYVGNEYGLYASWTAGKEWKRFMTGLPTVRIDDILVHPRDNDLIVNPVKGKKLTNIRAAGRDENIVLTPPIRYTLEQAMEFIEDDELVEITPTSIRLRKRFLKEHDRKRFQREAA